MGNCNAKKTGVLLVNLGSPASTKTSDVRRFLREFLSDPRVVNLPRFLWWLILNCFVLPFRPRKSAKAYKQIWQKNGSPLVLFTQSLTEKLTKAVNDKNIIVDYAMSYGKPAITEKLAEFKAQQVEEVVIIPLYPQYSSTTTASVYDAVTVFLKGGWHIPSLRFVSDYHQHPLYIEAIAKSIQKNWDEQGRAELLLMSFHGLPAKLTEWGDPYFHQCQQSAKLIAQKLGLKDEQWKIVFQSRFGKAEWLKPYCIEVLQELPQQGIKSVDVVCAGFAVDCLETLEEIAMTNKDIFIKAGGEAYHYFPALNDDQAHIKLMLDLVQN
ncbi:MAG: ferrochelatase [Methylococcaceae bacterium]|nr:ferrochelatase [Methylococcaceae bacterium]